MSDLTLTQIWIYPIKSLGGIPLETSRVLEKGLEFDRRWMLIDEHGVFMTQRIHPQMALFKLKMEDRTIIVTKTNAVTDRTMSFSADAPAIGEKIRAKIWDDEVEVFEIDRKISEWFSKHLNMSVRLVSFPEQNARAVDPKYKVNDENVSLADAYPFLIIGEQSLAALNTRLQGAVPLNRFRPNFVFAGGQPHDEDAWREFSIGTNRFVGVKPCGRCVLITVNQETAEKEMEPLQTLSTYRKRDSKVLFGQNLVALDFGSVKVGDKIVINTLADRHA